MPDAHAEGKHAEGKHMLLSDHGLGSEPRKNKRKHRKRRRVCVMDMSSTSKESADCLRILVSLFCTLKEEKWNKKAVSNIDLFYTGRLASNYDHTYTRLDPGRSIANHFPGIVDICSKAAITRCLLTSKQLFPQQYDFYPQTYTLPGDKKLFARFADPNAVYILKPNVGSRGMGISLARGTDVIQICKDAPKRDDQPNVEPVSRFVVCVCVCVCDVFVCACVCCLHVSIFAYFTRIDDACAGLDCATLHRQPRASRRSKI
jgi:hypothetical protein